MKRLVCVVVLLLASLLVVGGVSADVNEEPFVQTVDLIFAGPTDVFVFYVEKVQGAGDLTVQTIDGGQTGDHWQVELLPNQPAADSKEADDLGSGSTIEFTDGATCHPWARGLVRISYDSGIGVFDAHMTVKFTYTKSAGVTIEPYTE